ncbi:class I SAM-dependent methyltransferase [Magnetococcales bacterium HHB-1]
MPLFPQPEDQPFSLRWGRLLERPADWSVAATEEGLKGEGERVAKQLGIPWMGVVATSSEQFRLLYTPEGWMVTPPMSYGMKPFVVDFCSQAFKRRYHALHHDKKTLYRALVGKREQHPHILDATAGLGRDGFLLAASGASVTMLERSPMTAWLLADGLKRAAKDPLYRSWLPERLQLFGGDATDLLVRPEWVKKFSAVYLDPMFPERKKSAHVQKAMRFLKMASGEDQDRLSLLRLACDSVIPRVVIKRPLHDHTMDLRHQPTYQWKGKSTRFDVYIRA